MNCSSSYKSIAELKANGWEECFSFHYQLDNQWNMACDKVDLLKACNDYDVVLVRPDNEVEKKDGVEYLFKRKTKERL